MRFAKIEKIAARVAVGALALVSLLSMTASTRAQDAERPIRRCCHSRSI
jgi:hypothetical protein